MRRSEKEKKNKNCASSAVSTVQLCIRDLVCLKSNDGFI
jgi:hypothetical protein